MKEKYHNLLNITITLLCLLSNNYIIGSAQHKHATLCNGPSIIEKKIEKHSAQFRTEDGIRKGVFSILLGTSFIINLGNIAQIIYSFFANTETDTKIEPSMSHIRVAIYSLFRLCQSALATYMLHKCMHYAFHYYTYQHPIIWLLDFRVEIRDHFETLFCVFANQEKKVIDGKINEHIKQYIQLFVKIISKDTWHICAFMKYRSTLFPTYKQPTVTLIQNNILSFLAEWICAVDEILANQTLNLCELSEKTMIFKTLLYEQIDLFKKIDTDHNLFCKIITAVLQSPL